MYSCSEGEKQIPPTLLGLENVLDFPSFGEYSWDTAEMGHTEKERKNLKCTKEVEIG